MPPVELVDSSVSKVTLEPNAPLVVMLTAPPVPVFEHCETVRLPTAVPENPNPLLLLTVNPLRVFPLPRFTPFPVEGVMTGSVPVKFGSATPAPLALPGANVIPKATFNVLPDEPSPIVTVVMPDAWFLSKLSMTTEAPAIRAPATMAIPQRTKDFFQFSITGIP